MKKRLSPFVAGMATMALLGSLGVSALAATGAFTITVNPINIQVNGETFQPKDANGNEVPVFSLDGTTYAPLRALAEAYGLEVGYDAEKNMATVGEKGADPTTTPTPDTALSDDYSTWSAEEEAAYQEFKGMWEIKVKYTEETGVSCDAFYIGTLSNEALSVKKQLTQFKACAERLAIEHSSGHQKLYIVFYDASSSIGSVLVTDNTITNSWFPV